MSSSPAEFSQGPAPDYKLFDASAVAIATFFGTPVVGCSLMALNYRRLGMGGKAAMTLIVGIAVSGLGILLGWFMPQSVSYLVALGLLIATRVSAQRLQGAAIAEHVQRGGRLGSRWLAFGLGVAFCIALFGVIFAVVYMQKDPGVMIGTKDEVYYSGTATKDDATALGNALKTDGYFEDNGADVILDKETGGTIVSFIVKEGVWEKTDTVSAFEQIGRRVAPAIGGYPIKLRLLNSARDVKSESAVGRVAIGDNDHVYYFGTATDSDAQALGQSLKAGDFFGGKGSDVFLTKHSDGTVISFVVGDGTWNDPSLVAAFEKLTRQAAPGVGGLPVHLHLANTSLVVKLDEVVQ